MPPNPLAADLDEIVSLAEPWLRRLAGERLFITGGTGFFGRWLLEALTWADDRLDLRLRITVLSRDPETFTRRASALATHHALDWWRGDVRDFTPPPGSFPFVIHAATAASEQLNRTQPLLMFDTITSGTRHVLEFADRAGCAAMLLTSSGAVYGPQPTHIERLDENHAGAPDPNSPASAYGEGKRAAEFLCAASGLPVKIARGFAFVGPFLPFDAHFAVGNFMRDLLHGRPIEIQGDGTPYRSYLYAGDLVVWLLAVLLDGQPNRPYNVGSDVAVSIADLARAVATAGGDDRVRIQGAPSGQPPTRYVPSITRARDELGLEVWTPLDQALQRTLRWARAQDPSFERTPNIHAIQADAS
ncbi:NAD-dependent epimerase/dehydratase family protein [Thiobaca trueperi]|uniref:dTDP-glucose 4,6-dehydratase n=1 Tax=Thiobaca trueperi TaxID=127458 RepID=A0A4R3MVL9_9GAMM|nr:NAD(P)-dependent oxidoreductase [Thiobaca trueperi]TCT20225.1 dTDP-glucose 4,6-dehydratase [Thiobaca trueperi]